MRRWLYVLLPLFLLLGLIGWRLNQKKAQAAEQNKTRQARANAPVVAETVPATRRDIVQTFEAVGSVEAPLAVDLMPKVPGRIVYLEVEEGDRVTPGQVLAKLEASELTADVRLREATVAQAQARIAEAEFGESPQSVTLSTEVQRQRAAVSAAQALERQAGADYEAQIATAQAAVVDAEGRIAAAEANIASADAAIKAAEANLSNARTQLERQEALLREGATAQQVVDNARTIVEVQEGALGEAKERKRAAIATRESTLAQKRSAQKQVEVVRNKARADRSAAAAAVAQARAGLEAASANTGRNPAYGKNLEALRATARAAQADLAAARARLFASTLRSPLTGVVTRRHLDPGGLATPTQAVVSVQAIQQLWVSVSLPEEVTRRVYQGQTAKVQFDALPADTFIGKISQVQPSADPLSRQFTVRVRLDNSKNRIKPGMFGRVVFETERQNATLTVPREAVKTDPDRPGTGTVTVVADGKAQTRTVQTGISDANVIAIRDGLAEGDQVVVVTGRPLKDGQPVKTGGGASRPGAEGRQGEARK